MASTDTKRTPPRRISLRVVLAAVTSVPVVMAVVLTAFLSIRYGERLVQSLVTDLQREVAAGAAGELRAVLAPPHLLNDLTADLLNARLLDPADPDGMQRHFREVLVHFPTVGYIQLGLADGHFVGVERTDSGFRVERTDEALSGKDVWALDASGRRVGEPLDTVPGYRANQRPWYQAAVRGASWSDIYQFSSRDQARLGVTAVQPWLTPSEDILGVIGTDIVLAQLGRLLHSPRLRGGGRVFLMERSGLLVAHSHIDPPFTVDASNVAQRMLGADAPDPITRRAIEVLEDRPGGLSSLEGQVALAIPFEGDVVFLHAEPFRDTRGVDWVLAVALPRSDYAAEVRSHAFVTAALCLLAALLSVGLGMLVSIRVGGPILALADAAHDLANGRWRPLPTPRTTELAVLRDAFSWMRDELKEQRETLARSVQDALHAQQEAEAASKAKTTFLANMSHELRTPLNAILGYAELLDEESDLDDDGRADLARIRSAGTHLLGLISDVLELTRIESGQLQVTTSTCDAVQLVREASESARMSIEDNGNTLELDLPDEQLLVTTDEQKLRQCVTNLLHNAARFTKDGTVCVAVLYTDEAIRISVSDTGVGISESAQSSLFAPFTQGDTSPSRPLAGTGVGLAITREFIRALGGDVSVRSALGDGSEFVLTLPRRARQRRAPTRPPSRGR